MGERRRVVGFLALAAAVVACLLLSTAAFRTAAGLLDQSLGAKKRIVLVADSQGRIVEDVQPMTMLYLSCVAEQGGRRESSGYNLAGRAGFDSSQAPSRGGAIPPRRRRWRPRRETPRSYPDRGAYLRARRAGLPFCWAR